MHAILQRSLESGLRTVSGEMIRSCFRGRRSWEGQDTSPRVMMDRLSRLGRPIGEHLPRCHACGWIYFDDSGNCRWCGIDSDTDPVGRRTA